jgi:transposase
LSSEAGQEFLRRLPPCIEDYLSRDNPVRAIDAYVDSLDLNALDFCDVGSDGGPASRLMTRPITAAWLRAANREFVLLARSLELLGGELVALDGGFFHGDASKASILTKRRLEERMAALDRSIAEYHAALTANDQAEETAAAASAPPPARTSRKNWLPCVSDVRRPRPIWHPVSASPSRSRNCAIAITPVSAAACTIP